jgi:hypothetical protein
LFFDNLLVCLATEVDYFCFVECLLLGFLAFISYFLIFPFFV